MAPRSIRKALGLVKDQATISLALMSPHSDSDIEILVVKSTTHEKELPNMKHSNEILRRISISREKVKDCVSLISRRIERTHDWIVELKCLILVHRLIINGDKNFVNEIAYANSSSRMLSNLCGFKDLAHSNSWEYTEFVRRYGMYLVKKVELMVFDEMWLRKRTMGSFKDSRKVEEKEREMEGTHLRDELVLERVLSRMERLQRLLQRVLGVGITPRCVKNKKKNKKLVMVAFTLVVEESFELYGDISEGLSFLLDRFWGMKYLNCVKTYGTFATVAKQFDELAGFYSWCKGVEGADMPVEYPRVEKIEDDLLRSMEKSVKKKSNEEKKSKRFELRSSSLMSKKKEEKNTDGLQLVSFSDVHEKSVGEISETLDLSVHEEQSTTASSYNNDTQWIEFSDNGEPSISSDWETPVANPSNSNWETTLVESETNLSKQKPEFGGNFDTFFLDGIYDQGGVRQSSAGTGSASSIALPWPEEKENVVLALPSIDGGSVQMMNQDPFSASLAVPPPSYVQLAELEKKHHLLVQEQLQWQEYVANGMQGQVNHLVHNAPYNHYISYSSGNDDASSI